MASTQFLYYYSPLYIAKISTTGNARIRLQWCPLISGDDCRCPMELFYKYFDTVQGHRHERFDKGISNTTCSFFSIHCCKRFIIYLLFPSYKNHNSLQLVAPHFRFPLITLQVASNNPSESSYNDITNGNPKKADEDYTIQLQAFYRFRTTNVRYKSEKKSWLRELGTCSKGWRKSL